MGRDGMSNECKCLVLIKVLLRCFGMWSPVEEKIF